MGVNGNGGVDLVLVQVLQLFLGERMRFECGILIGNMALDADFRVLKSA